jgi:phage replication-related protein YjqB (UPF0714/DUF867 family)
VAPAREVSWRRLLGHPEVRSLVVVAGPIGLLAYHGGVEAGTHDVAVAAAQACGASLYALDQPEGLRWHVRSTLVDPAADPGLAEVLGHIRVALSVHGYGRHGHPHDILLGGRNRVWARAVGDGLRTALPEMVVVDDLAAIPPPLRGLHPANPVNLPVEAGVQIELPAHLRRSPELRARVAQALAAVVATHAPRVAEPSE